jgi:hypothetical protein
VNKVIARRNLSLHPVLTCVTTPDVATERKAVIFRASDEDWGLIEGLQRFYGLEGPSQALRTGLRAATREAEASQFLLNEARRKSARATKKAGKTGR